MGQPEVQDANSFRNSRNDTTTIWFDDLEGNIETDGWELDSGWVLTQSQYSSPTHSLQFDDDFIDGYQLVVSPLIDLPTVEANELLKYTFDVRVDMPDFDDSFFRGFSDHTIGISSCIYAVSRGAKIIEKHFSNSKNLNVLTQQAHTCSMDLSELNLLRSLSDSITLLKNNNKIDKE